ncbi:MAG: PspA/IM30 family protein [Chloroflexi bacterium]|nr:PspA/IM30 family protein [Chloroflexota bacterium]
MGIMSRMSTVFQAKISKLLERAEDPMETLDYSYEKQLELLQQVKRGIVEVVTSKRRLQMEEAQLQQNVDKLTSQAQQAVAAGRDDLAKLALQRKQDTVQQIQGLDPQIASLEEEQNRLTAAEQRLQAKVEAFRTHKEVVKAQYSAADAQVKIGESVTGLSEEMADMGLTIQRAEDKTQRLRAKAGAIDELVAAGTLEDITGSQDSIDQELSKITVSKNVDDELAAMKKQIAAPDQKQLKEGK